MIKTRLAACLLAGMLALGLSGAMAQDAAPDIKPGLWEMQIQGAMAAQMQEAMQEMQAATANMSPEERKMMQAQMGNMGLAMGGEGLRICMTQEDIKRGNIPLDDGKCTTNVTSRTATRWLAATECTAPPMTAQSEVIFTSPEAYLVRMQGVRMEEGRETPFEMEMNMKHISSDCGNVTPR